MHPFWRALRAMWDGLTLTCPFCRRGRMYRSLSRMNERCPVCGAAFEPEEGDFLGGIVVAYGVTASIVVMGVYLLDRAGASANLQFAVWMPFTVVVLVLFYRNCKGVWLGLLARRRRPRGPSARADRLASGRF